MAFRNKVLQNKRNKSFISNTILNGITKVLGILLNFLLVPLLLDVLGQEKYGIWQTFLSILTWGSLINFGLGNGLRNVISTLISKGEMTSMGGTIRETIKISSKITFFAGITIILVVIFFVDPSNLFKATDISQYEIKVSCIIFIIFYLINLVLSISNSIAFGFHKSFIPGISLLSFQVSCYLLVFILSNFKRLGLIHISIIFGLAQSVIYCCSFYIQKRIFKLNIRNGKSENIKGVFDLSKKFFAIQLLSIAYLSFDNIFISYLLGAEQTAKYSVVNKVFFSLINLYSILLVQLWNSTTDAYVKKEFRWIKKAIKSLSVLSILVFIASLVISFFSSEIQAFWLGANNLFIESTPFYLFSFYTLFHCMNAIFINISNGIGKIKAQVISTLIAIAIYIMGVIILDLNRFGYNGLICLKIAGMAIALCINFYYVKKVLK